MQSAPVTKYRPFPPVDLPDRQWPSRTVQQAPAWCSVDLRDGNQALAAPMSVEEKLEFFDLLVRIGFKEIEVGFPSASQIEFDFIRRLIEENRIPDDVAIQVLTQSREELITRTVESLRGARNVIIHLYNSTSPVQRKVVFGMDQQGVVDLAVKGAKLVKQLSAELTASGTRVRFEYSPESFSSTELPVSLVVCEAVMEVWEPTPENKIILNLPATVEYAGPNVHADQIEWMCRHLKRRELAIISLHTHNDRGTGTAATELGLLAGADRIEGTLFGNGERTGNLDIVSVALNLYTQGIHPGLDFSDLPGIRDVYERCTRMEVPPRHPYAGELVFTAFSGSHQDAIKKSWSAQKPDQPWEVLYIPIDPADIGRSYRAIIRINSQSGKGGVAYILEQDYGLQLPKAMHKELGRLVNELADRKGQEIAPEELYACFLAEYIEREQPLRLLDFRSRSLDGHRVEAWSRLESEGTERELFGEGNGPIDAFSRSLLSAKLASFELVSYAEHSLGAGADSKAVAYIQIKDDRGRAWFGAGIDTNIERASINALLSAINRSSTAAAALASTRAASA
jgi:2-isopropylmalate synthase